MNILLVRHAQSESNVDVDILTRKTNVAVELTDLGLVQAASVGDFLANYPNMGNNIKLWNSPYERTRKTSEIIDNKLHENNLVADKEESIYLSERQFGLVDQVNTYRHNKPEELEHYLQYKQSAHDFFARPPLGESPFDVCIRVDFFIKTILTSKHNMYDTHIIVAHGALIRAFIMMYLGKTYEYYRDMKLPKNASVHHLTAGVYLGEQFSPNDTTE